MLIRAADPTDLAAIARLHVLVSRITYGPPIPSERQRRATVDDRTALWETVLRMPPSSTSTSVFVAEAPGKIIGFGSCGPQRTPSLAEDGYDGEVSCLYVLPLYHRHGAGRDLMRAMADDLRQRGFARLSLWVLQSNAGARRFYETLGGVAVAEMAPAGTPPDLAEIAYGWRDISALMQATDGEPPSRTTHRRTTSPSPG